MSDMRDDRGSDGRERDGGAGDRPPDDGGTEGTIPADPDGVAAGVSGQRNTFEPEEDPGVADVDE
ncbi:MULTISPECIES: hypothetical protein [unclassified Agromyces]|uniref:hypothetical protein n=1 Tax=unclassified Agromyces TaxID=2639701 RepID=UPI003015549C